MKEVQEELLKPGFNSFGLGDCKAPKVLGDIVESIAGAIFLDSGHDATVVWRVSLIQEQFHRHICGAVHVHLVARSWF